MNQLFSQHLWISLALALSTFGLTYHLPFFWDSIQLASKQADFIFNTGGWLLSDDIDSGHPPGFGIYLSGWWHVLGRSLWVSHLAMLPFTLLLFYQLITLCKRLNPKYWSLLFLIVLVEPVLLGQLCLVSPDIALLGLLLLLVNAIFADRRMIAFLAILGLSVISTRAWMLVIVVYLVDHLQLYRPRSWGDWWRTTLPYIVGSIPAQVYLISHYLAKGWVGYHEASPWAASLETVPLSQMIYNVGILGWRLLDYGRVAVWILLLYLLLKNRRALWRFLLKEKIMLFLWIGFLTIIAVAVLPRNGIVGPRYLLPGIVFFHLWVIQSWLGDQPDNQIAPLAGQKRWGYWGILLCLIGGSFWVYPFRVAQAWDATPLHVVYHHQETKALDWLTQKNIELNRVGTVFPSIGPVDQRRLNGNANGFVPFSQASDYLFISGVHNDWSDQDLDRIEQQYTLVAQWQQLGVFTKIYQRKGR